MNPSMKESSMKTIGRSAVLAGCVLSFGAVGLVGPAAALAEQPPGPLTERSPVIPSSLADPRTEVAADVDGDGWEETVHTEPGPFNNGWRLVVTPHAARGGQQHSRWLDQEGSYHLAAGDLDGDGADELAVATDRSDELELFDLNAPPGSTQRQIDLGWGKGRAVTGLAFGDSDGDGREELAVSRNSHPGLASSGSRAFVLGGTDLASFKVEQSLFSNWGRSVGGGAVAWGDPDGDSKDELAIARLTDGNARIVVQDIDDRKIHDLATHWGNGRRATALAFGDLDGDPYDELAVARNPGANDELEYYDSWPGAGAFWLRHEKLDLPGSTPVRGLRFDPRTQPGRHGDMLSVRTSDDQVRILGLTDRGTGVEWGPHAYSEYKALWPHFPPELRPRR
jgi:FG-GAP-like repeat